MTEFRGRRLGWGWEMGPGVQSSQHQPVTGGQSHDRQRVWEQNGFSGASLGYAGLTLCLIDRWRDGGSEWGRQSWGSDSCPSTSLLMSAAWAGGGEGTLLSTPWVTCTSVSLSVHSEAWSRGTLVPFSALASGDSLSLLFL